MWCHSLFILLHTLYRFLATSFLLFTFFSLILLSINSFYFTRFKLCKFTCYKERAVRRLKTPKSTAFAEEAKCVNNPQLENRSKSILLIINYFVCKGEVYYCIEMNDLTDIGNCYVIKNHTIKCVKYLMMFCMCT